MYYYFIYANVTNISDLKTKSHKIGSTRNVLIINNATFHAYPTLSTGNGLTELHCTDHIRSRFNFLPYLYINLFNDKCRYTDQIQIQLTIDYPVRSKINPLGKIYLEKELFLRIYRIIFHYTRHWVNSKFNKSVLGLRISYAISSTNQIENDLIEIWFSILHVNWKLKLVLARGWMQRWVFKGHESSLNK